MEPSSLWVQKEYVMKKRVFSIILVLCLTLALISGCQPGEASPSGPAKGTAEDGASFVYPENETDYAALRTPGSQEAAYTYRTFFLPEVDGTSQPYVGDTMPYYEDGTYYIYYLKEAGDSYNHSVYLATTTDFVTYTEKDEVVLEASRSGGQDGWIGTGSVVKAGEKYYFFYTGHASSDAYEYKEKIMVAEGTSLTSFTKVADWEIIPPSELGQKNDFRDPQGYYDAATDTITLTVTASQANVARILKFTLSGDLSSVRYDGVIFSDPIKTFWNLECSDTFKLGDKYYITYSGQDDTLWYAFSDTPYGPYGDAYRLDGKLFYAAKHVESPSGSYMVGWARRSESVSSTQEVAGWAGNLAVQKLVRNADGSLALAPFDGISGQYTARRELLIDSMSATAESGSRFTYTDVFTAYESFMLTGKFKFTGTGSFGFAFDYNGRQEKYKTVAICPADNMLRLFFNEGSTMITETEAKLEAGKEYGFTYIQEGSVGIFYVDGVAALTVRLYGVSGKPVMLFAENNTVEFTELREFTR